MNKAINGSGWFVCTVSGLMAGDVTIIDGYNAYDLKMIAATLETLAETRVARQSRKGWWTVEHTLLGTLQWKSGIDFRSTAPYLYVRVNGKPLINCGGGSIVNTHWVGDAADHAAPEARERMEHFLGTIEHGTYIPRECREEVAV